MTRQFPTNAWQQYYVLQGRALWAYTRNPANVAGRSLMTIAIAVIEGAAFMHASSGRRTFLFVYHMCGMVEYSATHAGSQGHGAL